MSQITAWVSRIFYVPWWRNLTQFPSKYRSQNKIITRIADVDPSVVLRPIACWDCGFESRQGHAYLSFVLCVVTYRSLWWAGHSSRGFLPSVVCLSVIAKPGWWRIQSRWGARLFRIRPDQHWAHPGSYTSGTGSIPGVKWSERGLHHPPQYSVAIPLLPLCAFMASYKVNSIFIFTLAANFASDGPFT